MQRGIKDGPKKQQERHNVMKYIYSLKELPEEKYMAAGGKARSLSHMMKHLNIRIPDGYVILSSAFKNGVLCSDADTELDEILKNLSGNTTYAVRSSAINEDGSEASFAGQYETVTDVKKEEIKNAVSMVAASLGNANVLAYTGQRASAGGNSANGNSADGNSAEYISANGDGQPEENGIGIVIQHFVKARFAGVLFTADAITGRDDKMVGNYVRGEGEKLVSGAENAEIFSVGAIRYSYEGPAEFQKYAKELGKYCRAIRRLYGMPMDIEWAVANGRVYILQARPITTLRRADMDTYDVNGTRSGYKMLTRTNVGEIFMKPVSPMTYSVLEKINEILGLPDWLDNVCGQPYMNISVMVSLCVAFGAKKEKAYEGMKGLVGKAPEGVEVPVSPFDKKAFLKKMWILFFPKEKSKLNKKQKKEMVRDLADIARNMIGEIREIQSEEELYRYWEDAMLPKLRDGMASIIGQSGTSMVPLFNTRNKIAKIAGEETAERLCGGCLGMMESMKPLLLLQDLANGKITKEEYLNNCGHRCPNEMELMAVHPYEDATYVDRLLEEHSGGIPDLYKMQETQKRAYEEALKDFKAKYPGKKRWIDKTLSEFIQANVFREDLRSKGVWIFCVFREYLLQAGRLTGLSDDVFMLTFDEIFEYLKGDKSAGEKVSKRRKTYEKYCSYETFPNLIVGRFDAETWRSDEKRRYDVSIQGMENDAAEDADIKGFAGAAGVIRGKARVIGDIERISEIREGDILVTGATNVGWTPVFTKVSAIVTDIGAPLSHAAIVARECGIPAVVGCGNATTLIRTGDFIEVDGSAGTVRILEL